MQEQGVLTARNISCLVQPDQCLGLPTIAALEQGIPVIATYHPAFLLRQEQYKGHCWQDLQQVIEHLDLTPGAGRS